MKTLHARGDNQLPDNLSPLRVRFRRSDPDPVRLDSPPVRSEPSSELSQRALFALRSQIFLLFPNFVASRLTPRDSKSKNNPCRDPDVPCDATSGAMERAGQGRNRWRRAAARGES